eukprot:24675-Pelagococcus_subviridis.AAC.3
MYFQRYFSNRKKTLKRLYHLALGSSRFISVHRVPACDRATPVTRLPLLGPRQPLSRRPFPQRSTARILRR